MRLTRLVELSLFHRVQDVLAVKKTGEVAKSADFLTYKLKYRNVQPQYPVVVYVNGVPIADYKLDYNNGILSFTTARLPEDVVKVDYYYCPVMVYDEGKNPLDEDFSYPAVAVYEDDREDRPYELGNSRKEIRSTWVLEVWTSRGGERNDIVDVLMEMFDSPLGVIDYNVAFPILEDGTPDPTFDRDAQLVGYAICDSINCHKAGSLDIGDKPAYLAQIFVELLVNR